MTSVALICRRSRLSSTDWPTTLCICWVRDCKMVRSCQGSSDSNNSQRDAITSRYLWASKYCSSCCAFELRYSVVAFLLLYILGCSWHLLFPVFLKSYRTSAVCVQTAAEGDRRKLAAVQRNPDYPGSLLSYLWPHPGFYISSYAVLHGSGQTLRLYLVDTSWYIHHTPAAGVSWRAGWGLCRHWMSGHHQGSTLANHGGSEKGLDIARQILA